MHNYVFEHDSRLERLRQDYANMKNAHGSSRRPLPSMMDWIIARVEDMIATGGLDVVLEDVRSIVMGPRKEAWSYKHVRNSGHHFRIESADRGWRTMDCGIFTYSNEEDNDAVPYCGKLIDILEVDFGSFTDVLFGDRWYKAILRGRHATIAQDDCGFLRVKTSRVMSQHQSNSDLWVYPHQVDQ